MGNSPDCSWPIVFLGRLWNARTRTSPRNKTRKGTQCHVRKAPTFSQQRQPPCVSWWWVSPAALVVQFRNLARNSFFSSTLSIVLIIRAHNNNKLAQARAIRRTYPRAIVRMYMHILSVPYLGPSSFFIDVPKCVQRLRAWCAGTTTTPKTKRCFVVVTKRLAWI